MKIQLNENRIVESAEFNLVFEGKKVFIDAIYDNFDNITEYEVIVYSADYSKRDDKLIRIKDIVEEFTATKEEVYNLLGLELKEENKMTIVTTRDTELMDITTGESVFIPEGENMEVIKKVNDRIYTFNYKGHTFKEVITPASLQLDGLEVIENNNNNNKENLKMEQTRLTMRNYIDYDLETIEPIDADAVRDIVLCIENDSSYSRMFNNINNNLGLKMKKGEYDEHKAVKAFHNLVVLWLQDNKYGYTKSTISVHDRILTAHHLLCDNLDRIEEISQYKSITEVRELWNNYKREFLQDIKKDIPALKLEFSYFVDRLCKDGEISVETYNNIGYR